MKPVIVYLWIALVLNLICDSMMLVYDKLPGEYRSNTIFYNIHSLARFICFVTFFYRLGPSPYRLLQKTLMGIFGIIFILYFTFIDSFFNTRYISSDMMSGESFFLLCFCLLYYLAELRNDQPEFWHGKAFWVVTGISIFDILNFFIFLFYRPLLDENRMLALNIWSLHNIAFIFFILFLAKAIYVTPANKH